MSIVKKDNEFCPRCQSEGFKIEGEDIYQCGFCKTRYSKDKASRSSFVETLRHSDLFGPLKSRVPGGAYTGKRCK